MRKFLALFLTSLTLLSCSACGGTRSELGPEELADAIYARTIEAADDHLTVTVIRVGGEDYSPSDSDATFSVDISSCENHLADGADYPVDYPIIIMPAEEFSEASKIIVAADIYGFNN